ncbi:glutamate--tRNA ligase [Candidatus Woesearchaeota archaeon]|nr:glutamate--tRNA ligase [Candidatus Woesearchaeota archaeon]
MDLEKSILKYALQNAVLHGGKATRGAVIGKLLGENPALKEKIGALTKETEKIIAKVNKMTVDEQRSMLEDTAPELLEKKKTQKRDLPEIPGAEHGKVVTRLPPEPSKYNHIGHALSFLINYLYARKYGGKCLLKFEDTNPEKCTKEFSDAMVEDITGYLGIKPDKIIFMSDDMEYMYELAEKLIETKKAYVCECDKERIRELRHEGEKCGCRSKSIEKNMQEWKGMHTGQYTEGERVLRLVGDMESQNHVMRDPVLFRISHAKHFRHGNKYKVWPLYDFENAVGDSKYGVTHIFRSIEFGSMRAELQNTIKDILGMKKQAIREYGRFNITGSTTHGREIRELIKTGKYIGWHDPRLVTLRALKKRCIQKETYEQLAIEVGLSTTPTNIDFSVVTALNRKILDPEAKRYFLIREPHTITVKGAPKQAAELKFHPEKEKGIRKYEVCENFIIEKKDHDQIKEGELIRLMDCLNLEKKNGRLTFHSREYEQFRNKGKKVIHWLPADSAVKVNVMMPDAKMISALAEPETEKIPEKEIIQFVRFGFCMMEKREESLFWYGHE